MMKTMTPALLMMLVLLPSQEAILLLMTTMSELTSTDDNEKVVACQAGNIFSTLVIPDNDEFLTALAADRCINLLQVNQFKTQAF
jgi:hypothetical protein